MRIRFADGAGYVRDDPDRRLTRAAVTTALRFLAVHALKHPFAVQAVITGLLLPGTPDRSSSRPVGNRRSRRSQ